MKLILDNYFSDEASLEYMSVSQFKSFQKCEYSAHAQYVTNEYVRPITDALLVGSYIDAFFADTFDEWKEKHPEILNKSKKLRSPFIRANACIARIQQDKLFMSTMGGVQQKILIADINGVKWKCLPDFVDEFNHICFDLKSTKDFEVTWSDAHHKKVEFYEAWNYFLQLAVYQQALFQEYGALYDMNISAVTKEPVPDIKILSFTSDECMDRFDKELDNIREYQPFIQEIKSGNIPVEELRKCGCCDYCKSTKVLNGFEPAVVLW